MSYKGTSKIDLLLRKNLEPLSQTMIWCHFIYLSVNAMSFTSCIFYSLKYLFLFFNHSPPGLKYCFRIICDDEDVPLYHYLVIKHYHIYVLLKGLLLAKRLQHSQNEKHSTLFVISRQLKCYEKIRCCHPL